MMAKETVMFSGRVPKSLVKAIKHVALEREISVQAVLIEALERWLEAEEPAKKPGK
jgi:hypothetical protein